MSKLGSAIAAQSLSRCWTPGSAIFWYETHTSCELMVPSIALSIDELEHIHCIIDICAMSTRSGMCGTHWMQKKNSDMQEENANLETRIKKLEYETAKCVRMKERAERQLGDTEMYLESLQEAERKRVEFEESRILPEINMPPSTLRSTAGKTVLAKKSVDELVDIIDHLSSATERLKLENDKYRRAGLSNAKYLELMKECKALKREKEIYSDFEKHKAKLEAHISKIEEENQKLRKQIRKENNRAAHHLQRIEELEQRNEMLQSQIQVLEKKPHRSNRADEDSASCSDAAESNASELIQELRSQLAERDRVVQNLLSTEGSKQEVVGLRDKVRKLMQELDTSKIRVSKLSEQIVLLQSTRGGGEKEKQIARIPPGLVDDLEDLSFNYKESVRQNLQYEETIRSLCERIGLSPEHVLGIGGAGPSQW
ncbi:uncharacterized protein BJ171DRAFT_191730 [Polychytrium aggregatum]|uniref:uncharacterized protein n=1 Tax=Polychytrium aggregatum TaxID=110093 RepID=UPI0022FEFA57|nr:uncharacterized protein BJ171DRAFT_191730 [Polychytrium aggregatum]KAI9202122.1 hypothetical protein BJ171DRAFT_191730 [Polychytrium aggregatum]